MTSLHPPRGRGILPAALALSLLGACKTYYDHSEEAHAAVSRGDYRGGVKEMNAILGVDSDDELPSEWTADRPLAALERGVLLQALGEYAASSRDLSGAEMELEFLDLKLDTAGNIGKYIYSDSSEVYKTPPTERVTLNAINMLNYLAAGNLQGASTEARRFTVMRNYLDGLDQYAHAAFGSYLAGFTFEALGETNRALRYYDEALEEGDLGSLADPVLRLAAKGSYRGPQLTELLERAGGTSAGDPVESRGELLVVISIGRVPHKFPERIAIGAAIGYAAAWVTGDTKVLSRSATKVIVYPELAPSRSMYTRAAIEIDGREQPLQLLSNLGPEIAREHEEIKQRIIGAALTRLIARAIVAEGARKAGSNVGSGFGTLAALITEGVLVAADKPDTRSWSFLPERIFACRTSLPPGEHKLDVRLRGRTGERREITVDVAAGEFRVVVVTAPR